MGATVAHESKQSVSCTACRQAFSFTQRRHYCKLCTKVFCASCLGNRGVLGDTHKAVSFCDECFAKLPPSQRRTKKGAPQVMPIFGGLPTELLLNILDMAPEGILRLSATNHNLRRDLVPLLTSYFSKHYPVPSKQPEGWTLFFARRLKGTEDNNDTYHSKLGLTSFAPRVLPSIKKEGSFPYGAVEKVSKKSCRLEDNGQRSNVCKIPKECEVAKDETVYDCRHNEIVIACGRYSSSYPNTHPYTVTEATTVYAHMPNIKCIRCLFFISKEPVPALEQLEMTHCLNKDYVLANEMLDDGVYECGKSYGDFSREDRGTRYLYTLCPNLKYLKLSFPHVSWEDPSICSNMEQTFLVHNLKDFSFAFGLPWLEVLAVEFYEYRGSGYLLVWKRDM